MFPVFELTVLIPGVVSFVFVGSGAVDIEQMIAFELRRLLHFLLVHFIEHVEDLLASQLSFWNWFVCTLFCVVNKVVIVLLKFLEIVVVVIVVVSVMVMSIAMMPVSSVSVI